MKSKKIHRERLDTLLVQRGLARSLEEARAMIMAGWVLVNEQKQMKAGVKVSDIDKVRLLERRRKYVSRGGDKLEGAIEEFGIQSRFKDATVLDIGASTGGFTHCSLEYGAKTVLAVDVGTAQLDYRLRLDPRVISIEKTDIRDFIPDKFPKPNIVVGDISFNSISRLAPHIIAAANVPGTLWLLLIKPQFELSRDLVPTGGIVKDAALIELANNHVVEILMTHGLIVHGLTFSKLKGSKGNQESFIFAEVRHPIG